MALRDDVVASARAPASALLDVRGLAVEFPTGRGWVRVVDDVTFSISAGETFGLVGESGSGKSVTSHAILGLVTAQHGRVPTGSVTFEGRELVGASPRVMAEVRGGGIGMVFQQALRSLNPAFRVGDQIAETVRRHDGVSRGEASRRAVELLDRVHIPEAAKRARNFPHEFSGGMCQRAMIAMAIACRPRLLIADEPTTALDVTVQARILDLLRELQADTGVSILFISHDLAVIAEMCERVAVMYAGQVVEQAATAVLFRDPQHPYTAGLLNSVPRRGQHRLEAIAGTVPHVARDAVRLPVPPAVRARGRRSLRHRHPGRGRRRGAAHQPVRPPWRARTAGVDLVTLLAVTGLTKRFPTSRTFFGRPTGWTTAVDDVSFSLEAGETLAIVGESGAGKSTTGRLVLRLIEPDEGSVVFEGHDVRVARQEGADQAAPAHADGLPGPLQLDGPAHDDR